MTRGEKEKIALVQTWIMIFFCGASAPRLSRFKESFPVTIFLKNVIVWRSTVEVNVPSSDDQIRKVVNDVVKEHGDLGRLPTLIDPNERGVVANFVRDLFESIFGSSSVGQEGNLSSAIEQALLFVFENLHWVVFAVCFLLGWYTLVRYIRSNKNDWRQTQSGKLNVTAVKSAKDGLELALSRGDFAEATRWRWRFMLEQEGIFSALTPADFVIIQREKSHLLNPSMSEMYRLMFSNAIVSESQYRWFSTLLDSLDDIPESDRTVA